MKVQSLGFVNGDSGIPLLDPSLGVKYTLTAAQVLKTDPLGSPLVWLFVVGPSSLWVRWDGGDAGPPAVGAKTACPSRFMYAGIYDWIPTAADQTLSLLGAGDVYLMGCKSI